MADGRKKVADNRPIGHSVGPSRKPHPTMSKTDQHPRTNAEHCQGLSTLALACVLALMSGGAGFARAPERVLSLDQCADQYVAALAPRGSVVGLSHRADDGDSYMARAAKGLPKRRASFEAAFAARPDVVVRYWGGDAKLVRALKRRGVRVVTIEEAQDFEGVRGNVRRVSAALGRPAGGERLATRMDADLRAARGAWGGREALYLTPGGFTSGPGTLIDAMLRGAGLRNAARGASFAAVPLERLVLTPPPAFVLGFFDMARFTRWDVAGHPVLERVRRSRISASVPGKYLHCPAWFAGEGVRRLAEAAPGR